MRFALSTNWNNVRLNDGAAIADEAGELGFDSLELGFRTRPQQIPGFKRRLNDMPVESVHAYCPAPVGAPVGHPELYRLCSPDENERALAHMMLEKTFACAADLGAKTVVFHAGYVNMDTLFGNFFTTARKLRAKRGLKTYDMFRTEFDRMRKSLESKGLVLALENLPGLEGFPDLFEAKRLMREFEGSPLALWFDTGHALVRESRLWSGESSHVAAELAPWIRGIHLNDVKGVVDDHGEPGSGSVAFSRLAFLAKKVSHRVFEPAPCVDPADLRSSLAYIRSVWPE